MVPKFMLDVRLETDKNVSVLNLNLRKLTIASLFTKIDH